MAGKHYRWKPGQSPQEVWGLGAKVYVARLDMAIGELLSFWAAQIEASMKRNAHWRDRTANARQTLAAFAYKRSQTMWVLIARQFMTYGVYLEGRRPDGLQMRRGGKYAIVLPTLQNYYGRIWDSLQDVVK